MSEQQISFNKNDDLNRDVSPFELHWFDISDDCMLLLESDAAIFLLSRLRENYHTNKAIAYIIGNHKFIYQLKRNKPIRVKTLKRILDCLSLNLSSYDLSVRYCSDKSVYAKEFPILFDKVESAILIAAFLSDGNNQRQHPFYANTGFLGNKILKNVQVFFSGIPWEIRNEKIRFHPFLSHLLLRLGVPRGDKVLLNPKIPEFIYRKEEYKKAYLTQAFDDEGHAPTRAGRKIVLGRSVALRNFPDDFKERLLYTKKVTFNSLPESLKLLVAQQPPNLLKDEYDLLEELDIYSSLRCRGITKYLDRVSADWVIEIAGRENIGRFNKEIGFSHPDKIKRIHAYLEKRK